MLNRYLQKLIAWLRQAGWREFVLLFSLAVLCGSLFIFAEVTDRVMDGDLHDAERTWMRSLRLPDDATTPIGPRWLRNVSLDLTALGGVAILTLMTSLVAGYLLLEKRYRAVVLLIIAALGGAILSGSLKKWIGRDRPDIIPHLAEVTSASYPSGHSMLASIIYLTLGVMLARSVKSRRLKLYFIGSAVLVIFLIGLTRVFLGVHYPTDVLGGWAAGTAYAVVCALLAQWLQRRGSVEPAR